MFNNMSDVVKFVSKQSRTGQLQPITIPAEPWELITMNFVDGLPQSGKYNCLWVLVNKRTRYAHFLPLAHPYTASKVVQLYMTQIYKIHGFPKVSYRIGTQCSQAIFGRSYSTMLVQSCA